METRAKLMLPLFTINAIKKKTKHINNGKFKKKKIRYEIKMETFRCDEKKGGLISFLKFTLKDSISQSSDQWIKHAWSIRHTDGIFNVVWQEKGLFGANLAILERTDFY